MNTNQTETLILSDPLDLFLHSAPFDSPIYRDCNTFSYNEVKEVQLCFTPSTTEENKWLFRLLEKCYNTKVFIDHQNPPSSETAIWANTAFEIQMKVLDKIVYKSKALHTEQKEDEIIGLFRTKEIQLAIQGWGEDVDFTFVNKLHVPKPFAEAYTVICSSQQDESNTLNSNPPIWKIKDGFPANREQQEAIKRLNQALQNIHQARLHGNLRNITTPPWKSLFGNIEAFPFLLALHAKASTFDAWINKEEAQDTLVTTAAFYMLQTFLQEAIMDRNTYITGKINFQAWFSKLYQQWDTNPRHYSIQFPQDNTTKTPTLIQIETAFFMRAIAIQVSDWQLMITQPPLPPSQWNLLLEKAQEKVKEHLFNLTHTTKEVLQEKVFYAISCRLPLDVPLS